MLPRAVVSSEDGHDLPRRRRSHCELVIPDPQYGYDIRSISEQFVAKPTEIRQLLRGNLDPGRSRELLNEMRAAGLPT
ncbi:MAG: hypothetical protein P4L10_07890 [Acidobacteriaceae bacterium]|nr:hypothetical protein [Acidobacteriaceae bacterium]